MTSWYLWQYLECPVFWNGTVATTAVYGPPLIVKTK